MGRWPSARGAAHSFRENGDFCDPTGHAQLVSTGNEHAATPSQTEILVPGICAGAVPRDWRMFGGTAFGFGVKSLFIAEANRHDARPTRLPMF
jgi:hypothetical protein